MQDEIKRLGKQVLDQVEGEKCTGPEQNAVMCVEASFRDSKKVFWLYNLPLRKQAKYSRNFTGAIVGTYQDTDKEQRYKLDSSHDALCKNELLGGEIIQNGFNPFIYNAPAGTFQVEVQNTTDYQPSVRSDLGDALDGKIRVKGEPDVRFSSLRKKLEELEQELKRIELVTELDNQSVLDEAELLSEKIRALEYQIATADALQQRYVRESTQLRMQPILDSEQETLKRSQILNGMLVIDGGPGTGKTTTLIQRINFLTASTIREYRTDLTDKDLDDLAGNWRFFSPSRLLRAFLRNSMSEEGLSANDTNTKVWSDYLDEVFKYYQLFNSATQGPFVKAHRFQTPVIPNDFDLLSRLFESIERALMEDIRAQLNRVQELNTDDLSWSVQSVELKQELAKAGKNQTVVGFIQQLEEWRTRYKDDFNQSLRGLNESISELASRAQVIADKKQPALREELLIYLRERFEKRFERDDDLDDTVDSDSSAEIELKVFNPEIELAKFFRTMTTSFALAGLMKGIRKSEVFRKWEERLSFVYEPLELTEIAEKLYFRQFTSIFTSGANRYVFNRIPSVYKKNRQRLTELLREYGFANVKFEELVRFDRNRLHSDEMNLLLWYINETIKNTWQNAKKSFRSLDHKYVEAWKMDKKLVIAIDEASDFSLLEVAAIASFSHPKYNSVTLSGDLMQRMSDSGLEDWNHLQVMFPNYKHGRLTVSYRQSPTLLRIASQLYEQVSGYKPEFRSYLPESKGEPKPVVARHENVEKLVQWLEEQILHVYELYRGNIPSVAIFAENDTTVDAIAKELSESDKLNDVGIVVRACRSDAEVIADTQICVYNIKVIKGLEFEAVFFVNLDKIAVDGELLQKYLYVGLSRASYYMGLSYVEELPPQVAYLTEWQD